MTGWLIGALAAIPIVFIVLPAAALSYFLFARKMPKDFDERPDELDDTPYAAWKESILADIGYIRSLKSESVSITACDGISLAGEWYDAKSAKALLLIHGFCATPLNNFCTVARKFYDKGWSVLLVHQRGHGKSGGRITTLGIREKHDLASWLDWLEKTKAPSDVVVYGMSMGAATIAYASGEPFAKNVRAMVLDCGYSVPYELMFTNQKLRLVPWRLLMPFIRLFLKAFTGVDIKADSRLSLEKTACPAYFISGSEDVTVPAGVVIKSYEACASEKAIEIVQGAPHTLAFTAGGEKTQHKLLDFIEKQLNNKQ